MTSFFNVCMILTIAFLMIIGIGDAFCPDQAIVIKGFIMFIFGIYSCFNVNKLLETK